MFVVGSEAVAVCDILIFKKTLHFVVIACCVCLWVFFIERLRGLFVVAVLVIDFTIGEIVCRVCLLWFVLGVFLFGECGD